MVGSLTWPTGCTRAASPAAGSSRRRSGSDGCSTSLGSTSTCTALPRRGSFTTHARARLSVSTGGPRTSWRWLVPLPEAVANIADRIVTYYETKATPPFLIYHYEPKDEYAV